MMLPDDLLWAAGGHASDVVLTALADGETAIVPPLVREHVAGCSVCTAHLGNAALLALYTQRELETVRVTAPARRPLPRAAIGLGLVTALLGMVPSVLEAEPAYLLERARILLEGLATLARHAGTPRGAVGLIVPYVVAGLLVALGFAIVRFLPRKDHVS